MALYRRVALIVALALFPAMLLAASFGPQSASGATDDATVGTATWGTLSNVTASDSAYATVTLTGALTSHYLKVTFDLSSLPSYSSLDGIQIAVTAKKGGMGGATESEIKIVKNGTIGTTNKSTAATLTGSNAVVTYGATNNTWGETFTNGDTIGVVISYVGSGSVSASVDYVSATITYTAAAGGARTGLTTLGVGKPVTQQRTLHAKAFSAAL